MLLDGAGISDLDKGIELERIQYPSITFIEIECGSEANAICTLLNRTPNLCYLELRFNDWYEGDVVDRVIEPLPRLVSLNITVIDYSTLELLDMILDAAPKLTDLWINKLLVGYEEEWQCVRKKISDRYIHPKISEPYISQSSKKGAAASKPPTHNNVTKSYTVPSHTTHRKQKLTCKRILYPLDSKQAPIDVCEYRQDVFTHQELDLKGKEIKFNFDPSDIKVIQQEIITDENTWKKTLQDSADNNSGSDYYCKPQICRVSNRWQPLTTWKAQDKLVALYVDASSRVELGFSKVKQQYYIHSNKRQSITYAYVIQHNGPPRKPLPNAILAKALQYETEFHPGELICEPDATAKQKLDAMREQKLGRCGQRSTVFLEEVKSPALYVGNIPHAFCEYEGHTLDLGGYDCELEVIETQTPIATPELTHSIAPTHEILSSASNNPVSLERDSMDYRRSLILAPSAVASRAFAYSYGTGSNVPFFYITRLEQLRAPSKEMVLGKDCSQIKLSETPTSPLARFIAKHSQKTHFILINAAEFSQSDWLCLNESIKHDGKLDAMPIPKATQLMVIVNQQSKLKGLDKVSLKHYSRVKYAPAKSLDALIQDEPIKNAKRVELYNSLKWKRYLLGEWCFTEKGLSFKPSNFIRALQAGEQQFIFSNPPEHNTEFLDFIEGCNIQGGFDLYGQWIAVKSGLTIARQRGYDWPSLTAQVQIVQTDEPPQSSIILNPSTVSNADQTIDESGSVQPGWMVRSKGKSVVLLVTRELSIDAYAELFANAKQHDVNISLIPAQGVRLPPELHTHCKVAEAKFKNKYKESDQIKLVLGHKNISVITKEYNVDMIRQIDEVPFCDLFYRYLPQTLDQGLQFKLQISDCLQALQEGKTVLLYGEMSPVLQDQFARLLLPNQSCPKWSGQLIINSYQSLSYLPDQAMQAAKPSFKDNTSVNYSNSIIIPSSHEALTLHPSVDYLSQLQTALAETSVVLLLGVTGVGKSTLVCEQLSKQYRLTQDIQVLMTEFTKSKQDWLLFFDEANLQDVNYHFLEDLKHQQLWYQGKHINTKNRVKAILAMNPKDYAAGRVHHGFFASVERRVVMQPKNGYEIYHNILKPIFTSQKLPDGQADTIALQLLKVYKYCLTLSSTIVKITPRDMAMMAWLVVSDPKHDLATAISLVAYGILQPSERRQFANFCQQSLQLTVFDFKPILTKYKKALAKFNYVPIVEHQALHHVLLNFLDLRHFQSKAKTQSLCTGLHALIVEGPSDTGKTRAIKSLLALENIEYFEISPVMSFKEIEAILGRAYHKNILVYIHKMNLIPGLERLLNNLLTGHAGDERGHNLWLIADQYSISQGAGFAMSQALQRRCLRYRVPTLSQQSQAEVDNTMRSSVSLLVSN